MDLTTHKEHESKFVSQPAQKRVMSYLMTFFLKRKKIKKKDFPKLFNNTNWIKLRKLWRVILEFTPWRNSNKQRRLPTLYFHNTNRYIQLLLSISLNKSHDSMHSSVNNLFFDFTKLSLELRNLQTKTTSGEGSVKACLKKLFHTFTYE